MRVGVISDTHGLLRPDAVEALRGSDHIIHAGDIGRNGIIQALERIAPVTAIRGNVDRDEWAGVYPEEAIVIFGGRRILVLHDRKELRIDPREAEIDAIVTGHSHRPGFEEDSGVLYLNPGSAGPRRFSLPVTVAQMDIGADRLAARIVELSV